jgi:hypothetical protein
MISITEFNNLMAEMTADIKEENPDLEGYVLVATDNHLVRRLHDKYGVWLGVTIPSSDPTSDNEDSISESNIVWIFALEKCDPGSMAPDAEIQHYQKIQDVTRAVKNWLRDKKLEGNEHLEFLNLRSMHTDPEYQLGGWNGWSTHFNFETDGY